MDSSERSPTQLFQEFLQIPSISTTGPEGSYDAAVQFLIKAFSGSVDPSHIHQHTYVPGKPVLTFTIPGTDPSLPSILLNSHYDVVPAVKELWKVDPFSAHKDEQGNIFARGSQDMKCVCIQYLVAMKRIIQQVKEGKISPLRTIHLSYLPDEEIGGFDGAAHFVTAQEFKDLNVGIVLDEGLANPEDQFTVFYGERTPWWVKIVSKGPVGHGSRFVKRTAIEKLTEVVSKIYAFRSEQEALLDHDGCKHAIAKKLGDVVSMNVTALRAGVEKGDGFCVNVIPDLALCAIDVRIPPSVPLAQIEDMIKEWTKEDGLSYEFWVPPPQVHSVSQTENSQWWDCFKQTVEKFKPVVAEIFPAGTDSRFFRQLGIPAFGFSPISNTPILLHDNNEFLNEQVFLDGIKIYEELIVNLANLK